MFKKKRSLKFIDLFAGLGGFHLGLSKLGHKCVFASEINTTLSALYNKNYGVSCSGDIKKVNAKDIPSHSILCAGFPCQPFSKAGMQNGLADPRGGFILNDIKRILKYHKPEYIILENVPHLRKHNEENTWEKIISMLNSLGYSVKDKLSLLTSLVFPKFEKVVYRWK